MSAGTHRVLPNASPSSGTLLSGPSTGFLTAIPFRAENLMSGAVSFKVNAPFVINGIAWSVASASGTAATVNVITNDAASAKTPTANVINSAINLLTANNGVADPSAASSPVRITTQIVGQDASNRYLALDISLTTATVTDFCLYVLGFYTNHVYSDRSDD